MNLFSFHIDFFKGAALLFLLGTLITGCKPPEDFPDTPQIEFKEFQKLQNGDEANLIITFKDGDGNIGLSEEDTMPPFDPGSKYHYNLFMEYYEKQNGQWVKRDLNPPFYYRTPRLEPDSKNKALEGEIKVNINPIYYDPNSKYDTIKYTIQLVDRELNESNIVETGPILTP